MLYVTGQALSSLAPTLVPQAFCSSFYSPLHPIFLALKSGLSLGLLPTYLPTLAVSIYPLSQMLAQSLISIFTWLLFLDHSMNVPSTFGDLIFLLTNSIFFFFKHEENFLGFQPGHISIRLQGSGCYLYLVSTGFLGYHAS